MRAWIIGNGPSLDPEDLRKLMGEVCFGVNRIPLIFKHTHWRPTHWLRGEPSDGTTRHEKEIVADWAEIYKLGIPMMVCRGLTGIDRLHNIDRHAIRGKSQLTHFKGCPCTSPGWHLPELCTKGTAVNMALQWAVNLGYGPLYLLGCDLYGSREAGKQHFDKDYGDRIKDPQAINDRARDAYQVAYEESPVQIFNCTRGGALSIFQRLNIDEVLNANKVN